MHAHLPQGTGNRGLDCREAKTRPVLRPPALRFAGQDALRLDEAADNLYELRARSFELREGHTRLQPPSVEPPRPASSQSQLMSLVPC